MLFTAVMYAIRHEIFTAHTNLLKNVPTQIGLKYMQHEHV